MDDWLQSQAHRAQAAGTARTYVWAQAGNGEVLAYFCVAPTRVARSEVPRSLTGGYTLIPGYLLARLALDRRLQGQGLGGELLVDAVERIVDAAQVGGGRLIVSMRWTTRRTPSTGGTTSSRSPGPAGCT